MYNLTVLLHIILYKKVLTLSCSITNEDFKWFIVRKATNNYIDFEANIYDGASLGWTIPNDSFPDRNTSLPVITNKYIIRVEFNK